jgi:hypothetical protein
MASIHDSLLTGYTVDGDEKTLVLHTRPHQGGGVAYIDVVFRGVVAYHFEADCLGNIVFGIEEVDANSIIGDSLIFSERAREYGWPPGWDERRETAEEFFIRQHCRFFELTCSYGMYGWVAATCMEQEVRDES